jgi:hypothetical protein
MKRRTNCTYLFLCLLVVAVLPAAWGQDSRDSMLLLQPEVLKEQDVLGFQQKKSPYAFQSANRTTEEFTELPYSTWVITSDEILRYGMVTLADVLRAAPGVRVSQPGNALEGETFMMRGLSGNQYVKILINDVPIKPDHALGMPIGAQLPIRQAERIEVLYGSGGGLMYGNGACAGVVNIILKETERPIFTQADMSTGPKGYNNLDLMFGGRLFKDKNVLRFSAFGSSTVRNYDFGGWSDTVFSVASYLPNTMRREDLNASDFSIVTDDEQENFRRGLLNHESRMFGLNLRWRFLRFDMYQMQRTDPSCLGYSPMASSYASSGNSLRERINVYNVRGGLKVKLGDLFGQLTFSQYKIGNNSSEVISFDRLNRLAYIGSGAIDMDISRPRDSLINTSIFPYTSRTRYMAASSIDIQGETYIRFKMFFGPFWGTIGNYSRISIGKPQLRYGRAPMNFQFVGSDGLENYPFGFLRRTDYYYVHVSNYANLEYRTSSTKASIGVGLLVNAEVGADRLIRGSFMHKLDGITCVYANYSESSKFSSPYQSNNSIYYQKIYGSINDVYSIFENPEKKEAFRSFDIGVKRKLSEFNFFYQTGNDMSRDGYLYKQDDPNLTYSGYVTAPGLSQKLWGAQLRLIGVSTSSLRVNEKGVDWKGEFIMQYTRGTEYYGLDYGSSDLRNVPRMNLSMRSSGRSGRSQTTLAFNYQSKVLSKGTPFDARWGVPNSENPRYHPGFRSWDIMERFYLNRNFVLYINVFNIFNRTLYGLDASGNPDDLLQPLQFGRQLRLGITYNMN